MKKTPKLAANRLESIHEELLKVGSCKPYLPRRSKNAPRYEYRLKKLPKKEAMIRKAHRIAEALEELQMAMDASLDTHDQVYVELKPGSKAWKKWKAEPVFPLIISKEASDALLGEKKK